MGKAKSGRRFLIDAPLPTKDYFPRFFQGHVMKHVSFDFKGKFPSDHAIRMFAEKEGLTIITVDKTFAFKPTKKTSIIKITSGRNIPPQEIDKRLIKMAGRYKDPEDYEGKIIQLSENKIVEKNYKGERKELRI